MPSASGIWNPAVKGRDRLCGSTPTPAPVLEHLGSGRLALQMWLAGGQLCALPVLGWPPASLGGHVGGAGTFPCELTLKPGDFQVQLPTWTYWLSRTLRLT